MKFSLSRQTLYMLIMALLLLIVVLLFAFLLLIPKGKEYRIERIAMKKEQLKAREYQQWYDDTYEQLQQLRSENKHIIEAYANPFHPQRFVQRHQNHFDALTLSKIESKEHNSSEFSLYEVNATSKIDSPENFYAFLDQINKSEWIASVQFPIHFEREGNLIRSSFCMEVYSLKSSDATASNASGSK